jgi:hypothetical protein
VLAALLLSAFVAGRPYAGPEAVEVVPAPAVEGAPIVVDEPRGRLGGLAWAPDGRSVWVGAGSTLYQLRADTGAVIGRTQVPDGDEIDTLVPSPTGAHVAAATVEDHVTVWNSATGKVTVRARRSGWMLDELVTFSPDGKRVFAAFYTDSPDADEVIRIEAFDVASGRSLGKKRAHETPVWGNSAFEFRPMQLAGSHVYFDDLLLLVGPRPVKACDDDLPYAAAGELGWYGSAGVRALADCAIVRADTSTLAAAKQDEVLLSRLGERAAYVRLEAGNVTIAAFDLIGNKEIGRLEYGDVTARTGFALSADGSQVAIALNHREPDGGLRQFLLLWRPLATAEARLLALQIPR